MTDQQLLELAAKAAGIEVYWCDSNSCFWLADESDSFVPLDHDGDALRLAVKLMLDVSVNLDFVQVWGADFNVRESNDNDPYAATRRAIVRAAAEIGKTMGEQA